MTSFIISALLITAAALILLVLPLRKTRNTVSYERHAQNIHYAKERLQELEEQLHDANISATDYEALKLEIETTLAQDIDLAEQAKKTPDVEQKRSNLALIALLSVSLPLVAIFFYFQTGMPESFALAEQQISATEQPSSADNIENMVRSLEARLADNPNDAQGWLVLANSHLALGRPAQAQKGFSKVLELQGETPQILTSLADASGVLANGIMQGEPLSYVERALAIDPQFPQALWLAGLGAAQSQHYQKALNYWNTLFPLLADNPQQQAELKDVIEQLTTQQNLLASSQQTTTKAEVNEPVQHAENKATDRVNTDTTNPQLTIHVSLDPAFADAVTPADTVFVIVKAKQGPPAPLAVKRLSVSELPATVKLSDSDAMIAQFRLSLFAEVTVSARVSKSGQPIAQAGDIQSAPLNTRNDTSETINLLINQQVK